MLILLVNGKHKAKKNCRKMNQIAAQNENPEVLMKKEGERRKKSLSMKQNNL